MNIQRFQKLQQSNEKIVMVTCYDYAFAKMLAQTEIDCVLVGDSVAMVKHGYPSTVHATVEMMALHTAAVARGAGNKFIVADLPFLSYRKDLSTTMFAVEQLIQAGAHAVKLEGIEGNEAIIKHIVDSGIPVMGHLGLTPQSIHQLGGHKVQGKNKKAADKLKEDAKRSEASGCFSVVLECVPRDLASEITMAITVPTIGIGAGEGTSGQVLVLPDLLGFDPQFKPKLLKHYLDGYEQITGAVNQFVHEVKSERFPQIEHTY